MNIEDIPHIGEIWAGLAMMFFILLTLLSRYSKKESKLELAAVTIISIFWPIFILMAAVTCFVLCSQYLYKKITRYEY